MVRIVAESLHDLDPLVSVVRSPASVGIELLKVCDKWFDERFFASNLVLPNTWLIYPDHLRNNVISIESINDLNGFIDYLNLIVKVTYFEDTSLFEYFRYTFGSVPVTASISSEIDILESPTGENVRVVDETT